MRLFITGIAGFVGSRLARLATAAGDRVSGVCLGDNPPAGIQFERLDVLDAPALTAALAAAEPDAVVHLAALSHVGRSWEAMGDYFRANVVGTENLLAAAAAAGVERVVVASSSEVYGLVPEAEQPIAEQRPVDPRNPYALTKAAAERLALAAGAVVVRSFNLLGPGQAPRFALPSFARQLADIAAGRSEPTLAVGNLSARRDFLHVADGAAAYRRLVEVGEPGQVYNLASGAARSIAELLERLVELAGVEARVEVDPARMRPVDMPLLLGDAGRLRALGWEPRHGVDAALAELWQTVREEAA